MLGDSRDIAVLRHVDLWVTCFEKTFVQTSLRQCSRHSLVRLDFATIIIEHGKGCPHRRIGRCIDCNPIVLFPTNQASNDLITAMVAISTPRRPSIKLDVPDLPGFQALFSCHRSPYLAQVAWPDLFLMGSPRKRTLLMKKFMQPEIIQKSSPDSMPHFRNRPR